MRARWQQARAGTGQVVRLIGDAGIGKSRIAETLIESLDEPAAVRLRYQASPYFSNTALHPFIRQLEQAAGFARDDDAETKLAKLRAHLAASSGGADDEPLLAALLSLPPSDRLASPALTPQQKKLRTLHALAERVSGFAAEAPVVMLVEDAHWIDPTSLELLDLVADRIRALPVLLIVTSRTAADDASSQASHASTIVAERLNWLDSLQMASEVPGAEQLPAALLEQIVAKADGVPLFIEELAKTLASSAGDDAVAPSPASIPATLQDSLMARLDRLGPAKEIAQIGAVIGREFSRELVARIASLSGDELGEPLAELVSSAIVFGRGEPPWTAYVFKHALVQDAAYASLLRSKRLELHRRIAETLERSYPERVRTEPEMLAHHHAQAGHPDRAARYSAAAAVRALDRSANAEALGHAARGLQLLAEVAPGAERDRSELDLRILEGAAYRATKGFAASDVERSFARALELSERLGDTQRLIDVRRGLFSVYYARGALALAREQGDHVAALGRRLGDSASQMLGYWMLGCMASWQGRFEEARDELEKAVAMYDPGEQQSKTLAMQIDPGVNALCHLSWVLWVLGSPDRAIATSERAIAEARRLAQPFALAMALFFACVTRACCGQHAALRPTLDELAAVTGEHRLAYLGSCAKVLNGQELIAAGRPLAGIEEIERAGVEFTAQEAGLGTPWSMAILALGHCRLGEVDQGLAAIDAALEAMARNGERHWEAEVWRLKGELLLAGAHATPTECEACFRRAIEIAARQSARSLGLRATTSLVRLVAALGHVDPARTTLARALDEFREGETTVDLREARALLDTLRPASAGAPTDVAEGGPSP